MCLKIWYMPLNFPLIYIISCDIRNLNAFEGGLLNYRKYVSTYAGCFLLPTGGAPNIYGKNNYGKNNYGKT